MSLDVPRPNARGGRAARRANEREKEHDRLIARGVISSHQTASERAQAEALTCPICHQAVHPTNWSAHMTQKHKKKVVPLHEADPGRMSLTMIRIDGGTQPRAQTEEDVINDYAEAMKEGAQFEAVILFYDGSAYWLADGFHRVEAAKRAGLLDVAAEVHQGTQRDAILFSVGANDKHGLRRTNADKRRAVERLLRDDEWEQWSDREIAKRCKVTHPFVSKIRTELSGNDYQIQTRTVQRGGTTYQQNTGNIGKSNAPVQYGKNEDDYVPDVPEVQVDEEGEPTGFVEKAEITLGNGKLALYAPQAKTPADRYEEIKAAYSPDGPLFTNVYLDGPQRSGVLMIGNDDFKLKNNRPCEMSSFGMALWIPANHAGFVDLSEIENAANYSYKNDGRLLAAVFFPNLTRPQTDEDKKEAALGGRGATVQHIHSGQVGTLHFINGNVAYVETDNGRKAYHWQYLKKVESDSTLPAAQDDDAQADDATTLYPVTPSDDPHVERARQYALKHMGDSRAQLEDRLSGHGMVGEQGYSLNFGGGELFLNYKNNNAAASRHRYTRSQLAVRLEIDGVEHLFRFSALKLLEWKLENPPQPDEPGSSNFKTTSKVTRPATPTESQPNDRCQTPPYALEPILPYLQWSAESTIWEPAAGEGLIVEALYTAGWKEERVIASDILTGQNFFDTDPQRWDIIVTNPPYSLKLEWLERCYALGRPFALLVPGEFLFTGGAYELTKAHGFEMMILDSRVDFKMPNRGWDGTANYPTFWLTWNLLPQKVMYGSIKAAKKAFKAELGMVIDDDPE